MTDAPPVPPPATPAVPASERAAAPSARRCSKCSATAAGGRFCPECGAPFEGVLCAACRSTLTAGASFCHRCGTAVGSTAPTDRPSSSTLPWIVAAAALVVMVALVVSRNAGLGSSSQAGATREAGSSPDGGGGAQLSEAAADSIGGAPVRAPDISAMSPQERADRLYDRVMRLAEEGKQDSVEFFSPMVVAAYQMLGPLDADSHYDLGRIGEVTGAGGLARAEADSILRRQPTHLLGLTLAARVAVDQHRQSDARAYYRRLVIAAPAERAKNLPEYQRHQHDIDEALAAAQKFGGAG